MVISRAIRATGCASCTGNLLRSFAAITGPPIRASHLNARLSYPSFNPSTRFSSSTKYDDDQDVARVRKDVNDGKFEEVLRGHSGEETEEIGGELAEASTVPWYLEVDAPQRALLPLSERQQLPELPDMSPPILQPILEQLSIDIGLDSLALLDLRKLDPPPALGANLLMLLGTARSEKHLHVSADRFCRWLRSTYRLRPDADGLLGRNELKLKLKRKSKRAKLLGKSTADNDDDGVRTGWVCVDVGVVDGVEGSLSSVPQAEGYVGFGRRTDGVRIVVQMMTEEKREEMELERLWGGILQRGGSIHVEGVQEVAPTSESSNAVMIDHTLIDESSRRLGTNSTRLSQFRGFHTSARTHVEQMSLPGAANAVDRQSPSLRTIQEFVKLSIEAGRFEEARQHLLQHHEDVPGLQSDQWRQLLLTELRAHLESYTGHEALLLLGEDLSPLRWSPFLSCFHSSISTTPSKFEGDSLIWLYCYARQLGHGSYGDAVLMRLFSDFQTSAVDISKSAYLQLIRSILQPTDAERTHGPTSQKAERAVRILQAMHDQGHDILGEDIFVTLQEATTYATNPDVEPKATFEHTKSSDTFGLPSVPMTRIQSRIHVLMRSIDMPTFRPDSRLRLLHLYSRRNHWVEFWEVWRLALQQRQPQTPALYTFMFNRIAATHNQNVCINVLRAWIPDLEQETPSVQLTGAVARAVEACLLVADPFVERDAGDPKAKGEWISLWRDCLRD